MQKLIVYTVQMLGTRTGQLDTGKNQPQQKGIALRWPCSYCHHVQQSDNNNKKHYTFPQRSCAEDPGSLLWTGVLPSIKLCSGVNIFHAKNVCF